MNAVITMGGLGSRFRRAGYTVPKFMIKAKEKTLFEWSMISLEGYKQNISTYIFIAMKDDDNDVEGFIKKELIKLGIDNYKIILINYLTDGQATTAMLAEEYWSKEEPLLIYNIDTYIEPGQLKSDDLHGDGFIPCFKADGDHWSFVRTDINGNVIEIKEKVRISDNCTIGAYYFKSCILYKTLYEECYEMDDKLINGEKYVAPLYDYLLEKGGSVYISDIPKQFVHVLGTPDELRDFLNN